MLIGEKPGLLRQGERIQGDLNNNNNTKFALSQLKNLLCCYRFLFLAAYSSIKHVLFNNKLDIALHFFPIKKWRGKPSEI